MLFIQIMINTKATTLMELEKERENIYLRMETNTRVISKITKSMELVSITSKMAIFFRVKCLRG